MSYNVNTDHTPNHIDATLISWIPYAEAAGEALIGETFLGIYSIDGSTLTFAYPSGFTTGQRPSDFTGDMAFNLTKQ